MNLDTPNKNSDEAEGTLSVETGDKEDEKKADEELEYYFIQQTQVMIEPLKLSYLIMH